MTKTALHEEAEEASRHSGEDYPAYPSALGRSQIHLQSISECGLPAQAQGMTSSLHQGCCGCCLGTAASTGVMDTVTALTYPVHNILHDAQPVVPALDAVHGLFLAQVVPDFGEMAFQEDLTPPLGIHDHLPLLLLLGSHVVEAAACGCQRFVSDNTLSRPLASRKGVIFHMAETAPGPAAAPGEAAKPESPLRTPTELLRTRDRVKSSATPKPPWSPRGSRGAPVPPGG